MSKSNQEQKGFSIVEVLVVIVILAIVVFVGMRVLNSQDSSDVSNDANSAQQAEQDVPVIIENSDLEQAENFVNETDIDQSLDTSEIDQALEQ
jgi:prepilin-type N-terminal cleavage/methylation domain-containing protein